MTKILNGYIHRAQQKSEFTSLTLVFPAGSIYETPGTHGISHLMEHLICKLVDRYQDRFLNDCIDFNAETDFNYVQFYFRGLESKLRPEFKRELVTALLSGFDSITEEQFEMEKQIVIQEITDDYDDPYLGNLFNSFYRYYNIIEPGGIIDDVKNFSFAAAKKMYEDVFTKPLRIVEVGKEWSHFEDIEYCDKLPFKVLPKFKVTKKKLAETLEGDKPLVMVFGKRLLKRSDYQYMRIASVMLLQGLNSPFVQELREKRGLTYDISLEFQPVQDHCIFWLCATTDNDHAAELSSLLSDMCTNVRNYLTKERFDLAINFIKTNREIKKCSQWKYPQLYTENECPHIFTRLDRIRYEKLVGIVERYMYNIYPVIL